MLTFSFATTIVVFVVSVYGNDCKEYNLTPSDQSLIDMMKHYLHTSRKADTVAQSQQGQAGGNFYTNKGGGSNYLCLPSDPENGKVTNNDNDGLYGAEKEDVLQRMEIRVPWFLMSQHKRYNQMDFICMDGEAEPLDNRSANENGALFYPIKAKCGSLRCPHTRITPKCFVQFVLNKTKCKIHVFSFIYRCMMLTN
ncbi:unnamed protein product [Mytilus edulis]|uniref:Uncharacterized protein n=1 Tax=Mytilus edulis TaxID=6550 RepID=A0A8S3R7U0_MYTED|nr:unnamed protein product [Mytilus edulis]